MMCRKLCCILLAVLLVVPGIAHPESIIIPQGVTAVEESAFEACTTIETVTLPEGLTDIGKTAFKDCERLSRIAIPGSVQNIGENVFEGCPADLLISTEAGSSAAGWAMNNNRDFNAGTKYRALVIGQTYSGENTLHGPANDVTAMQNSLECFPGTPFEVTIKRNLKAAEILSNIQSVFGQAGENDVSLFYYSGHGVWSDDPEYQGALLGYDNYGVTASQLRSALDRIAGRKILVIDSCYSGVYAKERNASRSAKSAEDTVTVGSAKEFVDSFISTFSVKKRGSGTYSSYYIITASAEDEESWESTIGGKTMGEFTYYFTYGIGTYLPADRNNNSVITIQEAYQYACDWLLMMSDDQHAKVYPANCNWFGWLRK